MGASVGLAGCSSLLPGSGDDDTPTEEETPQEEETSTTEETADNGLAVDWETETTTDATASVVNGSADGGVLEFSVVQCNSATANGLLGELDTELQISFDYEVDPDQWYESRVFEVLVDDAVVYDSRNDDEVSIRAEQGTVTTGTVETSVDVDGATTVRLGLEPSDVCSNADHGETQFTVSALDIEPA